MDIMAYLEQVYQWMQQFYTPERLETPFSQILGWLEGMDLKRAGTALLWIVIIAVILDLVLYWTRIDQVSLVRRLWRGMVKLWKRLTAKPQGGTAE